MNLSIGDLVLFEHIAHDFMCIYVGTYECTCGASSCPMTEAFVDVDDPGDAEFRRMMPSEVETDAVLLFGVERG